MVAVPWKRFPGFAIFGFVSFNNKCAFNCKILYTQAFQGLGGN
jgi:hypothetical protein